VWHDALGSFFANNMPGYKSSSLHEWMAGMMSSSTPSVRDLRKKFNSHWYREVVAGAQANISLRTRGGERSDVVASLRSEAASKDLGTLERLGMQFLATHHQKTIVIDYEGDRPCGYVLGLNSVTDYWDTKEHKFNDSRRGESWEGANDAQPGLKPYQDYGCRIEGQALAAVCKNFTEAWNKADAGGKGAGSNVNREIDLKRTPANLIKHLEAPRQRAQILRTLPSADGSEKSVHRLYDQAASFARHYLYVENQYFQHAAWVKQLKQGRKDYLEGCQQGNLKMADVFKLHVMVVMPTPERSQMVPRTHDTVTELGYGSSMPDQAKRVEAELERYDVAMAQYKRNPLLNAEPHLSSVARTYREAGGGKDEETARNELEGQLAMRSMVASLWSFNDEWPSTQKDGVAELKALQDASPTYEGGEGIEGEKDGGGGGSSRGIKRLRQKLYEERYREIYIHSKLMIIDDSMFTLGSANLNLRSFAVDSEINIASDDAHTAKNLRVEVWAQHTREKFAGGDATNQEEMYDTFQDWVREAADNLQNKKKGARPSCFLVAFRDERTSSLRLG
jgi:phosphatidylserine/phosphatidylglycerophosphate/cardiolipin synthase-like enzyme